MPISDLGEGVLWQIFLMNADLDAIVDVNGLYELNKGPPHYRYSPLTVTRRSSQVCQSWRDLILGSSSIWGRVIHLDFLNQEKDEWRSELLRRTGEAPLCVKGEVIGYVTEDFFLCLLETEWTRIRRIDVRIHNDWEFEDETWEPLLRPSPTLESFKLNYSYGNSRILSGSKAKLFANNAPSLREFHSSGIPFSLQASWISQLRHITLGPPFNIAKILNAFRGTRCLESVQLDRGIYPHQSKVGIEPLPHVILPCLQSVTFTGLLGTCLQFLDCITPASGCSVWLNTTNNENKHEISSQELAMSQEVFTRCSQNYFNVYSPKRLALSLERNEFLVYDLSDPIRLPSSPTFRLNIYCTPSLPTSAFPIFMKSISVAPMSGLTYLELHILPHSINPHNPDITKFMYGLSSLETLQISSVDTLEFLSAIPWTSSAPFSALRTLKMVQSLTHSKEKLAPKPIKRFLDWRVRLRVPIVLIDLTFCDHSMFGDLGFLENFRGLVVKWSDKKTDREYFCGTNIPGYLKFT